MSTSLGGTNTVITNRNGKPWISTTRKTPLFFVMMRLNLKMVLGCLSLFVFVITFSFWSRCGELSLTRSFVPKWNRPLQYDGGSKQNDHIEEIECTINQKYSISCRKEGDEVFLPFSFLHDYFEIFGTLTTSNEISRFEWSHSNKKVNYPKGPYDSKGIFMYFENYNVEMRDRVKCISASEGVPISTQWESQGYFYPTQIAQFGLSHYSKNLTEPDPRRKLLEDGDGVQANWNIPKSSTLSRSYDASLNSQTISFQTNFQYDTAITLPLDHVLDLVLSVDIMFKSNSSMLVSLENRETKRTFNIYYIVADIILSVQDENIYYGLGADSLRWKRLTRDLLIDLQKGIPTSSVDQKRKLRRTELRVTGISLIGVGSFDNLTLATSDHLANFYDAAEWFVRHQDTDTGGWPNPVKRKLGAGFADLQHGWYSSMGQGHAISLLARAYYHSRGDAKYLTAALNGLKPFRIASHQGGVLTTFLEKYAWYEEYPTSPPSFVLNGFIYSLLGLYDLNSTVPARHGQEAGSLFEQGMVSLKKMLTLFDMGSGTSYDLRHFTLGIAPNIARWDYHATHVNQLLLLATIDSDPLFAVTAKRWQDYMLGKRAPHN